MFHVLLARWRREFAADRNRHPARFFRFINEVPTLLLIAIVILVVVKPFSAQAPQALVAGGASGCFSNRESRTVGEYA